MEKKCKHASLHHRLLLGITYNPSEGLPPLVLSSTNGTCVDIITMLVLVHLGVFPLSKTLAKGGTNEEGACNDG